MSYGLAFANAALGEEAPAWWTSDDWSTPREVMVDLELRFGKFDLDPCCRPETAKAPRFYTLADDGLSQPWFGRVFVNPPYSSISPWVARAWREVEAGNVDVVVVLLPAATDTAWFHSHVWRRAELIFMRSRVRFIGWKGTPLRAPRSPSMLAVYR